MVVNDSPFKDMVEGNQNSSILRYLDWYNASMATRTYGNGEHVWFMHRWGKRDFVYHTTEAPDSETNPFTRKDMELISLPFYAKEYDVLGRKPREYLRCDVALSSDLSHLVSISRDLGEYYWTLMFQHEVIDRLAPDGLFGNVGDEKPTTK